LKKKNARKFIQQQANKESRLLMKATKSSSRGAKCEVRVLARGSGNFLRIGLKNVFSTISCFSAIRKASVFTILEYAG
jgi:hypothetical protein